MSDLDLRFVNGAVYLPRLGLWLDAHEPQGGKERVFVSHAHSDHIAEHREVILTPPTAQLMEERLPGARTEHVLPFEQTRQFAFGDIDFKITLLPAGHIFGSAMSLIETAGQSLLYTGDFKLRRGLSAEPCKPQRADILIMETTFGRPQYVFPPTEDVLQSVIRFCREALDNDETPVLLGYSLGKSQELLCSLGEAGFPLMLHGTIFRLTKIYERFGQCFPGYERYDSGSARGKVLLCPPNVINSAMLRNLKPTRTAVLTGWAVDPNCKYRYQCDAAFPLSDHADFPDLLKFVEMVEPKRVYTLHGFAAEFAQVLRHRGYDARALSQDEQFSLALNSEPIAPRARPDTKKPPQIENGSSGSTTSSPFQPASSNSELLAAAFTRFAETCRIIGSDSRKLEKIRVLGDYLKTLEGASLAWAGTWFSGRPFPSSQNKVLQLGWAVLRNALVNVSGSPEEAIHQAYLKYSDLGETAAELLQGKTVQPTLTLEQVGHLFEQLQAARGPLAKTPLLSRAFERCTAIEAKYLVKIITGDLRIGLKEGLVEEAVAAAFGRAAEDVRSANLLLGDIGQVAILSQADQLKAAALVPFRPIKFMLASPEETAADVWNRMHRPSADLWIEDKYDGVRCQVHKVGKKVALYSRDLKDITTTFLDLADSIMPTAADAVLDGEIVAMRGEQVLPFAELQKRLGRRQGDLFMREEVPIKLVVFDLLWLNGSNLLDQPLRERRRQFESIGSLPGVLRPSQITAAHSPEEIEAAFAAARARGNEGLMIKDPDSLYAPGRRGLAWVKLKKAFATLDCVVVGAEYGHGKRNKVLSDYTFAVRDENTGQLKTIGKAYSGLTDAEIAQLTEHFLSTATRQQGRYFEVPPDTVLEIAFDRLQRSERHNSGLAMRFPRIARIRTDKSVSDIDTLQTAREILVKLERNEA